MMKTNLLKTNLLIMAMLLISSGLMAQDVSHIWENTAAGGLDAVGAWEDPANWRNGSMPGTAASGRAIFRGGTVTMETDVTGDYRLELGDNKNLLRATLTIKTGGKVGANRAVGGHSEVGIWAPATLTIEEGASLSTGTHFWIGCTKNYTNGAEINAAANMGSEVHLNGGTITVGQMFGIDFYNNKESSGGTLFMNGGLLDLAQWKPLSTEGTDVTTSLGKHGKIVYTGGMIKIKGDHKASLESFVASEQIIGEFDIWVERIITVVDNVPDTTYVTKLSNEAPAELSTDATLSALILSEGTLDPVFDAAISTYTAQLPAGTTATPTITATTTHANATVVITDATNVASAVAADRTSTVEITAEDGVSKLTYTVVFEVKDDTSVSDLSPGKFSIYPNPVSSMLFLNHTAKIDRVEIYNITGSKIYSQQNVNDVIDVSGLNSGVYFISVTDAGNNNIIRRFIKQ